MSDDPIPRQDLGLPASWWEELTGALEKLSGAGTGRVAVRETYMARAVPDFVGITAPPSVSWATTHGDLYWANLTAQQQIPDWEARGWAAQGFDAATLYPYTLLHPGVADRVRAAFPVLGSVEGLAAEAVVCAMLLQTAERGDNLALTDQLRVWAAELRHRPGRQRPGGPPGRRPG
ncbi:hypothetical protein [Streptomyces sp. NPDC006333]|uniref:hypothetical protein n=1 Tax=Streptomyces sp. NPDC006333 TaxID=3156753 RepID=UPI0033BA17FD